LSYRKRRLLAAAQQQSTADTETEQQGKRAGFGDIRGPLEESEVAELLGFFKRVACIPAKSVTALKDIGIGREIAERNRAKTE